MGIEERLVQEQLDSVVNLEKALSSKILVKEEVSHEETEYSESYHQHTIGGNGCMDSEGVPYCGKSEGELELTPIGTKKVVDMPAVYTPNIAKIEPAKKELMEIYEHHRIGLVRYRAGKALGLLANDEVSYLYGQYLCSEELSRPDLERLYNAENIRREIRVKIGLKLGYNSLKIWLDLPGKLECARAS